MVQSSTGVDAAGKDKERVRESKTESQMDEGNHNAVAERGLEEE
jgi:hypothetical protein